MKISKLYFLIITLILTSCNEFKFFTNYVPCDIKTKVNNLINHKSKIKDYCLDTLNHNYGKYQYFIDSSIDNYEVSYSNNLYFEHKIKEYVVQFRVKESLVNRGFKIFFKETDNGDFIIDSIIDYDSYSGYIDYEE